MDWKWIVLTFVLPVLVFPAAKALLKVWRKKAEETETKADDVAVEVVEDVVEAGEDFSKTIGGLK